MQWFVNYQVFDQRKTRYLKETIIGRIGDHSESIGTIFQQTFHRGEWHQERFYGQVTDQRCRISRDHHHRRQVDTQMHDSRRIQRGRFHACSQILNYFSSPVISLEYLIHRWKATSKLVHCSKRKISIIANCDKRSNVLCDKYRLLSIGVTIRPWIFTYLWEI